MDILVRSRSPDSYMIKNRPDLSVLLPYKHGNSSARKCTECILHHSRIGACVMKGVGVGREESDSVCDWEPICTCPVVLRL